MSNLSVNPKSENVKRTIRNPQAWIGKHIDTTKWNIPYGYNICEMTRKFYPESQLEITFDHYAFDRSWLIEKNIYVEDAAWLSEEGWNEIVDVLKREGEYSNYIERAFGSAVQS